MIRVGVFGAGYWGPIAEAMTSWLSEVAVDRVWSRSDERSAELAAKVGCRTAEALDDVASLDLADHQGLRDCPESVFPALVLVALFAKGTPTPDLDLMASCMEILS